MTDADPATDSTPARPEPETVRTRDGRDLAYAEYGDPEGYPVFFFHGTPGSRLGGKLLAAAARAAEVRLIAPDRPGIGGSDPDPGRTLLDWPEDLAVLVGSLGLDRFGVLGFSGGGAFALACAYELSDWLDRVTLVNSVTPPEAFGQLGTRSRLAHEALARAPWLSRGSYRFLSSLARNRPEKLRSKLASKVAPSEAAVFEDGETGPLLIANYVEAFRQGTRWPAYEGGSLFSTWPFDVSEVTVPATVWHGTDDDAVPVAVARWTADALADADLRIVDGEGHYSTLVNRAEAILRTARPEDERTRTPK